MNDDLLEELLNESMTDQQQEKSQEEDEILAPLLDEINYIQDNSVRQFVRSVMSKTSVFWYTPAAWTQGHHPPDELGKGGNVLHTKRVVRIVGILAEAQARSGEETDVLVAAALLHDLTKAVEWSGRVSYDPMHPYTVDALVSAVIEMDMAEFDDSKSSTMFLEEDSPETIKQILRLVRSHMGIWSPVPETMPLTTLDWTLHFADNIASKLHYIIDGPVYNVERWNIDGAIDRPEDPKED